jgi:hypothetical protein
MDSLSSRLHKATRELRTRPIAIADMIPLMLEAADALEGKPPHGQRVHQNCHTCTCPEPGETADE